MRREEAERLDAQGVDPVLSSLAGLEARIEELERRQGRSSLNSSLAPSRDPPLTRQQRRQLARERAKRSLRKPGGQPGDAGKTREPPAPEQITRGL